MEERDEQAQLLGLLPNVAAYNVAKSLSPLSSIALFQASRAARDLVLQHAPKITYKPGSRLLVANVFKRPSSHESLGMAAQRKGNLSLSLMNDEHVFGQDSEAWLAEVFQASLSSALAGDPWVAVTELRLVSHADKKLTIGALAGAYLGPAFPALQRCTLQSIAVHGSALFLGMAGCKNLQHLTMDKVQLDETAAAAIQLLAHSTTLASLNFDAGQQGNSCSLPALPAPMTSLHVQGKHQDWERCITPEVAARLQHLALPGPLTPSRFQWPVLHTLITPSVMLGQADVDQLLAHAPHLHTVAVKWISMTESRADAACSWRSLTLDPRHAGLLLAPLAYLPLKGITHLGGEEFNQSWLVFDGDADGDLSISELAALAAAAAANLAGSAGGRAMLQAAPLRLYIHEREDSQELACAVAAALAPLANCSDRGLSVGLCCDTSGQLIETLHESLGSCITQLTLGNVDCDFYVYVDATALPALCSKLPRMDELRMCDVEGLCDVACLTTFCLRMPRTIALRVNHLGPEEVESVTGALEAFGHTGTSPEWYADDG